MSDIKKLREALELHPEHQVIFKAIIIGLDSKGGKVERAVYCGGSDDQFVDGDTYLNIILCDSDGSYDVFKRFDALESALEELVASEQPEELLGKVTEIRNQMLVPSINSSYENVIGDKASSVIEMIDLNNHPISKESFFELNEGSFSLEFSMDVSYDKPYRQTARVQAGGIESIYHDDTKNVFVVTTKAASDNYDVLKRINALELLIDKMNFTLTKTNKINAHAMKQATKLLSSNRIMAG